MSHADAVKVCRGFVVISAVFTVDTTLVLRRQKSEKNTLNSNDDVPQNHILLPKMCAHRSK